jgi:hypothetical protein
MSDAPAATGITTPPPAADAPKDAAPADAVVDPKAEINAALKKAGVKLKAKDREYVPRDIDDLTSKAQRVYGLEAELEKFKSEKTEADTIKQWRAAVEADDEDAASRAFDVLSPKAQANAAKWLQRKAAAWEQERQLPPEAVEAKRRADELEAKLAEYRDKEQRTAQERQRTESVQRLREAHGQALKVAQGVVGALKASEKVAPTLVPLVARHMRVALSVAEASGEPVDEAAVMAEVQENVRSDVLEQFSTVAGGMDDDALYDAMGEQVAKRLMRVALRRRNQQAPTSQAVQRATGNQGQAQKKADPKADPRFGTPSYFR